jgi:hypothetical protein
LAAACGHGKNWDYHKRKNMKNNLGLLFVFLVIGASAQTKFIPTEQFIVEGKVQHAVTFTMAALDTFKIKSLPDVVITNHVGVVKNTLVQLKGVLVKDILAGVPLQNENPKVLSEFYFIFVATDKYKVVFSWNEIFNSPAGDNFYIITSEGGKKLKEMDGRISILCVTDFKTGRRDLKNLDKIIVERVN